MQITFGNVDEDLVHATQGPTVRFDLANAGTAPVRAMLTVDEGIHIGFPSKKGGNVTSNRKLAPGLHPVAVLITAQADQARRDYDFTVIINGLPVMRAQGRVPDEQNTEIQLALFQLVVR